MPVDRAAVDKARAEWYKVANAGDMTQGGWWTKLDPASVRPWESYEAKLARYNNGIEQLEHKADLKVSRIDARHEGRMAYNSAVESGELQALRNKGFMEAKEGGALWRGTKKVFSTPKHVLEGTMGKIRGARNTVLIGAAIAGGVALAAGVFGGKKNNQTGDPALDVELEARSTDAAMPMGMAGPSMLPPPSMMAGGPESLLPSGVAPQPGAFAASARPNGPVQLSPQAMQDAKSAGDPQFALPA